MNKKKEKTYQMSDSFRNAAFLLISGGFQDAYTYFFRGGVFANAQTGNIVLMSAKLFDGDFKKASYYLVPLLFFMAGVFVSETIHRHLKNFEKVHWRQLVLLFEIFLLFIVGFIPIEYNIVANSVVSFVCAMQLQAFKKFHGKAYASTMCIGNMRSATEALCGYIHTKDKKILRNSIDYYLVILLFAIGAGLGFKLSEFIGIKSIWGSCVFLFISFCFMKNKEKSKNED